MSINWGLFRNFEQSEYECKCGCRSLEKGEATVSVELVKYVQELRDKCGFALPINSALRCKKHNDDPKTGGHPTSAHVDTGQGCMAVDLGVDREKGRIVLQYALDMGVFEGIGIQHRGASRVLHLDIKKRSGGKAFWSYA